AVFTVTLSEQSSQTVTVKVATADGTATAPVDYTAVNATLTFMPGQTTQSVSVPIVGDTLHEANETFTVNLSNPVNGAIASGGGPATGTTTDDDPAPSLSINAVSVLEGNSGTPNAFFPVTLSAPSGLAAQVSFATADGTATAGSDYQAQSGTL